MIKDKELERVAEIARISLTPEEKKALLKDFGSILDYFSEIQRLETGETVHYATPKTNTFREDGVVECKEVKDILENAPRLEKKFFKVPKNL